MPLQLPTSWFSRGSKISGCASVLGSWQICHNVCTSLIAALATVGIAVQGMPLLFLNRLQWPLWIAALVLFGVLLTIRMGARMLCITNRGMMGNAGLLLAGLPFDGSWVSTSRTVGLVAVLFVLLWYVKDLVVKRVGNTLVLDFAQNGRKILGGVVGVIAVVGLFRVQGSGIRYLVTAAGATRDQVTATTRMKFTLFDIAHAKELMDKDGDGQCDACGMAIDQCIDSGMMQCTMDRSATIGLLGSQHIHAGFTVYRGGKQLDLAPYAHVMEASGGGTGSSFIHVEGSDFNRLHMHATGVPLKMFFDSIGMKTDGAEVRVNGRKVAQSVEYAFKDGERIEVKL